MVREIAFINGGAMDPADFAFAIEAIRIQLHRDFLPAWQDYLPVKRPIDVMGYSSSKDLAPGSFAPIQIVTALDNPEWLGDHGGLEVSDTAWGRSMPQSTVMSHEAVELAGDPFGNRWVRLPSGLVTALEVADGVENDHYAITATIGGQSRDVWVSNFVHPAYFGEGAGQFDHMGLCTEPGENRGYLITQLDDGTVVNVFAAHASEAYRKGVELKLNRTRSRTFWRHNTGFRDTLTLSEMRERGI